MKRWSSKLGLGGGKLFSSEVLKYLQFTDILCVLVFCLAPALLHVAFL